MTCKKLKLLSHLLIHSILDFHSGPLINSIHAFPSHSIRRLHLTSAVSISYSRSRTTHKSLQNNFIIWWLVSVEVVAGRATAGGWCNPLSFRMEILLSLNSQLHIPIHNICCIHIQMSVFISYLSAAQNRIQRPYLGMATERLKINWKATPFQLPILFILSSQVTSTVCN